MNGQQQELGGPTPLERLGEAVEAYLRAIDVDGSVQGFVLLAQTVTLDPDAPDHVSPVGVGSHYATTLPAATGLGLADGFSRIAEDVVGGSMRAWASR